jgi:NAD(P)-dependent dehydrogenase (short-subunit alcohol dehydrogenase family)
MLGAMSERAPVAIVTGGVSGIGRAIGAELARRHWHVALADIDEEALRRSVADLTREGSVEALALDVTDAAAVERAVESVANAHDGLDMMVNNAGAHVLAEFRDTPLEDWERLVSLNLLGVVHGCRAAYDVMRRRQSGRILNVASVAGLTPAVGETAYCATKHAVVGFSLSLRAEADAFGIAVSVACPGLTDTAMMRTTRVHRLDRERLLEKLPYKPMTVEVAARRIVSGALRGKPVIVPSPISRALWWLHRLSPRASLMLGRRVAASLREARIDR